MASPGALARRRLDLLAVLLLASAVTQLSAPADAYGDYDDSGDEFWQDSAPKQKPKEKIDPQTGQRLVATTIRFFQARLKPDHRRTRASTSRLAAELNELFLDEGMSHNKATAPATHVISIQSRDEWDELKDVVFSMPAVYDVTSRQGLHERPGASVPYRMLWRAEMGADEPVPLAEEQGEGEQQGGPSSASGAAGEEAATDKSKTTKKAGSRRSKKRRAKGSDTVTEEL